MVFRLALVLSCLRSFSTGPSSFSFSPLSPLSFSPLSATAAANSPEDRLLTPVSELLYLRSPLSSLALASPAA